VPTPATTARVQGAPPDQEARGGPAVGTDHYGSAKNAGDGPQTSPALQVPDKLQRSNSLQQQALVDAVGFAQPRLSKVDPKVAEAHAKKFEELARTQKASVAASYLDSIQPPEMLAAVIKRLYKRDEGWLRHNLMVLDEGRFHRLDRSLRAKLDQAERSGDPAALGGRAMWERAVQDRHGSRAPEPD
jgi:hypothetical protein